MTVHFDYTPTADVEPTSHITAYDGHPVGIPVLDLAPRYSADVVKLHFNYADPSDTIRYLRQLAAVATDLADQVEHAAAEAVLTP